MKILITRPSPMGEELVEDLKNIGIIAYHFSLLDCIFSDGLQGLTKNIQLLYKSDKIIIFSPKAVYYTNLYLKKHALNWPSYPQYYAIGQSTATLLQNHIKKKF